MKQQEREANRERRGERRSHVTKEPLANVCFPPLLRSLTDSICVCVCVSVCVCVAQIPAVYQFHIGDEGFVWASVCISTCVPTLMCVFVCVTACVLAGQPTLVAELERDLDEREGVD